MHITPAIKILLINLVMIFVLLDEWNPCFNIFSKKLNNRHNKNAKYLFHISMQQYLMLAA